MRWAVGFVAVGLLVLMYQPPADRPSPDDEQQQDAEPVDRFERAYATFAELHRSARGIAVRKLRGGELKTAREANAEVTRLVIEANDVAFLPVSEYEAARMNGGNWTPELHADLLEGKEIPLPSPQPDPVVELLEGDTDGGD